MGSSIVPFHPDDYWDETTEEIRAPGELPLLPRPRPYPVISSEYSVLYDAGASTVRVAAAGSASGGANQRVGTDSTLTKVRGVPQIKCAAKIAKTRVSLLL